MNSIFLILPILIPVAFGLFVMLRRPKNSSIISFVGAVLTGLSIFLCADANQALEFTVTGSLSFLLHADGISVFFLCLIAVGFACAILYAREYLQGDQRSPVFFGFTLMTLGAMMGLSLAGNIVTFYMFYEMMSLLSFPMVLYSGSEKARRAAIVYLGFSVFGASMALMGILLGGDLAMRAFSEPIGETVLSAKYQWAYLLMALGFSCKAGMMPLANWLPTAHPVAPAPASALLSGIITKAGILGIIRSTFYLFGGANLAGTMPQTVMLVLSIATIFAGSMLAYKEKLLKKRLAYSSVSQLSYVIFGLMLMSAEGLSGALLQVVFHACAKVGLFLCAGAFIHHCHVNYVDELTGMGRRMPKVMAAFTCFSLSLIGIPPFGGFISKFQIAAAALDQGTVLAQIGVIVLMVSALLTAGYLLPIVARGYFPGEGCKVKKTDAGMAMVVPLFVLAAIAAVLGMFPQGIMSCFSAISANLF